LRRRGERRLLRFLPPRQTGALDVIDRPGRVIDSAAKEIGLNIPRIMRRSG